MEIMDLVDNNDKVVGSAARHVIKESNLLHRGVAVLVFNSKGELFVHKRTMKKEILPGYFDLLCAGGVLSGETYLEAAKRELSEEIGIADIDLKQHFKVKLKSEFDNCYMMVFSCIYDGRMQLEKSEIENGMFIDPKKIDDTINTKDICPGSIEIWKKYKR
ncbi:MAG: NUDIX domain-containing protein [Candidatus Woesearchaeota archaeon]